MALFALRKNFLSFANSFNGKPFLVRTIFSPTKKIFLGVTRFPSCLRVHWEACKFLSGDKMFCSLTAILCQVILFREHDQ